MTKEEGQREEIKNKQQLVEYFKAGNKAPDDWGIGTENEQFLFLKDTFKRLAYNETPGIGSIFEYLQNIEAWQAIIENENIIGLSKNGASITLEPGGQFELSGKKFSTVHETFQEINKHFTLLQDICKKFGISSVCLGFDPLRKREEIPWVPKKRYEYMRNYMPTRGNLGLDMMTRTACIQVNIDYADEADMVKKMRVAQAFQPAVTAIFANSPFTEGRPNGFVTYRARVWDDTDPDRCGFLPMIFDEDFGFEKWVDYLLDIPMYFIHRNGDYFPSANITFREFIEGKHQWQATMLDWETHVSTVFPDVRLKQFIELRGADAGCVNHIAALAALWVGVLYDQQSLDEALELCGNWDIEVMQGLRSSVPVKGLKADFGKFSISEISKDLVDISLSGLSRRSAALGIEDEGRYLIPAQRIVDTGKTQAERHLENYHQKWKGDIRELIKKCPDING